MNDSVEKLYKVTLPNGKTFSVKALYTSDRFISALLGTDSSITHYEVGETPVNNWMDFRNDIGSETFNALRAEALSAQLEKERKRARFYTEVQELCIISHCDFNPDDPMPTLQNLIQWNVAVALDPSVSAGIANLHRQINERNEFLAREILPILDDVPTANIEPKVLDALQHYISESPGDTPYVYNSTWDAELETLSLPDEDPELLADVVAGRQAAEEHKARRLNLNSAPTIKALAPIWKRRQDKFKSEAYRLLSRRKALHIRRQEMAEQIGETVKDIQRVENGLGLIGTTRIRKKIDSFLTKAEKEMA